MQRPKCDIHERTYSIRPLLAAFILFTLVFSFYFYTPPPIYTGSCVDLIGQVSDISYRATHQNLDITGLVFDGVPLVGSIRVKTRLYPLFSIGDSLKITGTLENPPGYLHLRGISALSSYPALEKVQDLDYKMEYNLRSLKYSVRSKFFSWRDSLIARTKRLLPEPHSSLLAGILFGYSNIPSKFSNALKKSGTTHIVVASGFNFVVVISALTAIAFLFGRWGSLLFSVFGVIFYALIVGGNPPVVRAALMTFLAFLGQFLGRQPDSRFALFFSSVLLLHFSPNLLWNVSFQLTFCATLGMVYVSPFIVKYLRFLPKFFRSSIAETWSAQIATYPVLFFYFSQPFSFISFICNILIITAVPFITWLGFLSVFSSYLSFQLSGFFSFLLYAPLEYVVSVINLFS